MTEQQSVVLRIDFELEDREQLLAATDPAVETESGASVVPTDATRIGALIGAVLANQGETLLESAGVRLIRIEPVALKST